MLPGQVPYTQLELQQLYGLVDQAALGDPGEEFEEELLKEDPPGAEALPRRSS